MIDKLKEKAERLEAAGIPDSPVLRRDPPAIPPSPAESIDLSKCHLGGVALSTFPDEWRAKILWQQTDEGIAALNAGKSTSRVKVAAEPLDKSIVERRDQKMGDIEAGQCREPWEYRDALKEVADQHVRQGMRPHFLSKRKVAHDMHTRGWEIVKNKNGDPVEVGDLVLGQMPEDSAVRRNKHFQKQSSDNLKAVYESMNEKLAADGMAVRGRGVSVRSSPIRRAPEPEGADGLHVEQGNQQ